MKNAIFVFVIILLTFTLSCEESIDEKLVLGNWTAAQFLENGAPKEVDLNSINFSFFENQTYTFQGLMNKEAGNFHLSRNLLYSTDTLSTDRIEKSVKIIKASSDSLFFEMNNGGTKQIIKLYKMN